MEDTRRFRADKTERRSAAMASRVRRMGHHATAQVARMGGPLWRLDLEGTFKPGWLGNLGASLVEHDFSVLRGHAVGDPLGRWTASLELECPGVSRPDHLDFVALADDHRRVTTAWRTFDVSSIEVHLVPEHGGALLLDVSGRDRVGFLGALLDRLALVALFPTALTVETTQGWISDRLWLKAAGFRVPDPELRERIARHLKP